MNEFVEPPDFEPLKEPGPNPFTPSSGNTGGTWVPEDQQTPTWRIFNKLYMCRLSVFQTRSLDDIEFYGVPVSGDKEYDDTMRGENRLYYKTVAQLLMYFKNDVAIGLFKVTDAKPIYEDCRDHMAMWQRTLLRSPNIKPTQDVIAQLQLLDRFAKTVYPHAESLFTEEFTESILLRSFRSVGFGLSGIGLPAAAVSPAPTVPEPQQDEGPAQSFSHESFDFVDVFNQRRSNWRGE
jgi:hypothetical protein